jgi:hypothetical protein
VADPWVSIQEVDGNPFSIVLLDGRERFKTFFKAFTHESFEMEIGGFKISLSSFRLEVVRLDSSVENLEVPDEEPRDPDNEIPEDLPDESPVEVLVEEA